MKLNVKVTPNSNEEKIIEGDPLKIYITVLPEKGKANKAVIRMLSKLYKVPQNNINIVSGFKSRNKIVEIK